MEKILKLLKEYQDEKYGDFIQGLTPTISRDKFIGVRVPNIKKIAKEISNEDRDIFFNELPHFYYEETLLHAFLIQRIKDYDECLKRVNEFLPYVDNWATSDTMSPKVFSKHKEELMKEILKWVKSKKTYTVRFGVDMLMTHYLDDDFKEEYLCLPLNIDSEEYYINMMIAWYYATALAKQYDSAIKIIENKNLKPWIHNKSIQKAIESNRISIERKDYLRTLKIK